MSADDDEIEKRGAAPLTSVKGLRPSVLASLQGAGYRSVAQLINTNLSTISIKSKLNYNDVAEALAYCFFYLLIPEKEYQRLDNAIFSKNFIPDLIINFRPQEFQARTSSFLRSRSPYFRYDMEASHQDDFWRSLFRFRTDFLDAKFGFSSIPDEFADRITNEDTPFGAFDKGPNASRILDYVAIERRLDRVYEGLRPTQAIAIRGIAYFLPVVFSIAWLSWETVSRISSAFVGVAIAQTAAQAGYKPPLGLPQPLFNVIVCAFATLLLAIMAILFWQGFLARKKSAKAARIVEHFSTLLLGVFFGSKL